MRKTKFTTALLSFSLLLAANAIAGNSNKGTLHVDETVTVGGKQLSAGKYQVQWVGSGSEFSLLARSISCPLEKRPLERPPLPIRRKGATDLGISSRSSQTEKKEGPRSGPSFFVYA